MSNIVKQYWSVGGVCELDHSFFQFYITNSLIPEVSIKNKQQYKCMVLHFESTEVGVPQTR